MNKDIAFKYEGKKIIIRFTEGSDDVSLDVDGTVLMEFQARDLHEETIKAYHAISTPVLQTFLTHLSKESSRRSGSEKRECDQMAKAISYILNTRKT